MDKKDDKHNGVYTILKRIPKGKVTTYGAIGEKLSISPRYVGRILSDNIHPVEFPCYKVVRSDGGLGGYTVKGKNNAATLKIKKGKLLKDGVRFKGNKVDRSCIVTVL